MWSRIHRVLLAAAVVICGLRARASPDSALAELKAALSSNNAGQTRASIQHLLSGDENADALLNAGALLASHDRLPDAAAVFEKCSQRFPASFEAKYNLTLARIGLNEYEKAQNTLSSTSPASARETAAVQYLQGKIQAATGRQEQARQSFESAYRANPGEENYALDLALVYIRSSIYVPAIQILERSLAQHPDSEELALELALSDALAGRQANAVAVCRKLIQKYPGQPTPRVIAAFANCMRADFHACEVEASAGLALPHADPYLHYLYAEALWNSGSKDHAKMLSDLGSAVDKMPTCSACLLLRSKVLEAAHDDHGAIADLKAALGQDAQLGPAWYRLSVLYRKTGQSEEAADAIRRYRALNDQQLNGEIESFRKRLLGSLDNQSIP